MRQSQDFDGWKVNRRDSVSPRPNPISKQIRPTFHLPENPHVALFHADCTDFLFLHRGSGGIWDPSKFTEKSLRPLFKLKIVYATILNIS